MNKTIRSLLVMMIMVLSLVLLTACGENKLVATKTMTQEEDGIVGDATIEITFVDDNTPKDIEMSITFEDENQANDTYQMYQMIKTMGASQGTGEDNQDTFDVNQDGKTVKISTQSVGALMGEEQTEAMNKEQLKQYFEDEGYTVK